MKKFTLLLAFTFLFLTTVQAEEAIYGVSLVKEGNQLCSYRSDLVGDSTVKSGKNCDYLTDQPQPNLHLICARDDGRVVGDVIFESGYEVDLSSLKRISAALCFKYKARKLPEKQEKA